MPRVRLNTAGVVAAAAELADESGLAAVNIAAVAARLGVQPPALYKHIDGADDLLRRIATLAMTEFGDAVRAELQGRSRSDAVAALFAAYQRYIAEHAGRFAAITAMTFGGPEDPFLAAATRVIDSIRAVLAGYGIADADLDHAIRMLRCLTHGFAVLQAANGFQWSNDPDESVDWMIRFVDVGLRALGEPAARG